ncbi:50S ribosomal protein L11 methyltransferase [Candidatus Latescibacterota bacterium]
MRSDKHIASIGCDSWCSVSIECEPGFEDILSTSIFDSGFSGLEETKIFSHASHTLFTAFFPQTSDHNTPLAAFERELNEMAARLGKMPGRIVSVGEVPFEDWEMSWREGLDAIEIGTTLVVRPSWVEYTNSGSRVEIIIDPKMAFGTGSHATTYLCLEALEEYHLAGKIDGISVLDAGCGSGVLSIAAAKFGARTVHGFDYDGFSVENAVENIGINNVGDRVTIENAELAAFKTDPCDIVFANMISGVLVPNLAVFHSFLGPDGEIVFSGILAEEQTYFTESLTHEGFVPLKVTRRDEWIAVYAREKHD